MLRNKIYRTVILSTLVIIILNLIFLCVGCADRPQIVAYLNDKISIDQKNSIGQEIKSWEEVEKVIYISAEEAFERLDEKDKEAAEEIMSKGVSPVPASFEIYLKSSNLIDVVVDRFVKEGNYIDGIVEVVYGRGFMALFKD